MPDNQLILAAIEGVRSEMNTRFDATDEASQQMKLAVEKVLDDHESRIRSTERSITKFKTLGSAVATLAGFFGWDFLRHHWPFIRP